jgi:hypothetical protein
VAGTKPGKQAEDAAVWLRFDWGSIGCGVIGAPAPAGPGRGPGSVAVATGADSVDPRWPVLGTSSAPAQLALMMSTPKSKMLSRDRRVRHDFIVMMSPLRWSERLRERRQHTVPTP